MRGKRTEEEEQEPDLLLAVIMSHEPGLSHLLQHHLHTGIF